MNWIIDVEIGDMLMPIPLWNKTERRPNQLHTPTEILDIATESASQSGFLFLVRKIDGTAEWLDAEWFTAPSSKQAPHSQLPNTATPETLADQPEQT